MFREVQVENDDAWRGLVAYFLLSFEEGQGFSTVSQHFDLVGFPVLIQRVAKKEDVGRTILNNDDSGGVALDG